MMVVAVGCPATDSVPAPDQNGNVSNNGVDPSDTTITAEVKSFKSNFPISELADPVDVVYSVTGNPTNIDGFYVPVSAGGGELPGAVPVISAPDLPAGAGLSFPFDPKIDIGYYRVGLIITDGSKQIEVRSLGTIQVQGAPDPEFIRPAPEEATVFAGTDVTVSFNAGDPEDDVQWRLFYTTDQTDFNESVDEQGVTLAVSVNMSNVGTAQFFTDGLPPGEYTLWLAATDSGTSIAATVQNGNESQIVTAQGPTVTIVADPPPPVQPSIVITVPGAGGIQLFGDNGFNILFTGTVTDSESGLIDVLYDSDEDHTNGFELIAEGLDDSVTAWPFPTNLPEGEYYVGVRIDDGINDPVTAWAVGTAAVVRTAVLAVTAPSSSLPVAPDTAVTVTWSTNVPVSNTSSVQVLFQSVLTVGGQEIATGELIPVTEELSTAVTSAVFKSVDSGVFAVYVRLTVEGDVQDPVLAPEFVRVSSLPPVLWLGSLATANPAFEGAIFAGVNFEDNTGSAFTTAGDLDDDGNDEFVIAARYGKPFFQNPSGIGIGEAYLVYGENGSSKLIGEHNLNSLGLESLRGVLLTGIPTAGDTDETEGLSTVTLVPDADRDELGELVFGFPRTNSKGGASVLDRSGQFLAGGVVILSSNNTLLRDPESAIPVINLEMVGQRFTNVSLADPETIAIDNLSPDTDPPCDDGTDDLNDTVIGPYNGFIPQLATPLFQLLGLIAPGTPCSIVYTGPNCFSSTGVLVFSPSIETPGSGFFPMDAIPLEPFGARILGTEEDDRFGTSVAVSIPFEDQGSTDIPLFPANLIISAPNRAASTEFFTLLDNNITGSGVAYMLENVNLWEPDTVFGFGQLPPTPHQYVAGVSSHCGDGRAEPLNDVSRVAGDVNDGIQTIIGIDDFNSDGRNDFAVGAPEAFGGSGRVYIAFRRDPTVEGDFLLDKLELSPNNAERLEGVLLKTTSLAGLGASLATGVDLNGDGTADLVIGSPNAGAGTGEVIVVFGDPTLTSPIDGISIADLLLQRDAFGNPRAARITGNSRDVNGQFGFNVANAGDIDGDGLNDLLIAAPNASPRFDSNPTDSVDELDTLGLDVEAPFGEKDDVSGPSGVPDQQVDSNDDLLQAGIVYVIYGSNRFDQFPGSEITISIEQLGSNSLRGFMIVGRRACDHLGGGDASELDLCSGQGLGSGKQSGRSAGLGSAGDVDGDGRDDILIGAILADPRVDVATGTGTQNGGEAYLIYSSFLP